MWLHSKRGQDSFYPITVKNWIVCWCVQCKGKAPLKSTNQRQQINADVKSLMLREKKHSSVHSRPACSLCERAFVSLSLMFNEDLTGLHVKAGFCIMTVMLEWSSVKKWRTVVERGCVCMCAVCPIRYIGHKTNYHWCLDKHMAFCYTQTRVKYIIVAIPILYRNYRNFLLTMIIVPNYHYACT